MVEESKGMITLTGKYQVEGSKLFLSIDIIDKTNDKPVIATAFETTVKPTKILEIVCDLCSVSL